MLKKFFLFIICTALALGLFIGFREYMLSKEEMPETQEDDYVIENYVSELKLPIIEVDSLNPILTKNRQVSNTLSLIYEPLIELDESNQIKGVLASEWAEKDDFTWIIKLKENVKWHSVKAFTSEDVKFTIDAILNYENSTYYQNVKNISNVEIIDASSVSISLKEKDDYLPYKLTFAIIPKYYLYQDLENSEKLKRPIGTGAYKFESITDDEFRTTLKFNSNWWKTNTAKLQTVYLYNYATYGEAIKAFKSAEIDLISTSMSSWKKKFGVIGINSYSYENAEFELLIPNTQNVALSESSVRKAILYAINRNNVIGDIYEGNANVKDIMIHEYSWLYDNDTSIEYSPEKSKQLLLNAGWQQTENTWYKNINGKNVKLKFELLVNENSEEKIKVAEVIKENLEDIGIQITIKKVNLNTLTSNIEQSKFELALSTIELQNECDIIDLLKNKKYSKYESSELDDIINELYLDNVSFEEVFKKLKNMYKSEVPYIGLYFKTDTLLTNRAVKGHITPTWYNTYHNIHTWCK